MKMIPLPIDLLRDEIIYNPKTGEMRWRRHRPGRNADRSMPKAAVDGYKYLLLFGQKYAAARVAFAIYHGRLPMGEIDHIDGDPGNNRIKNLREATRQQNNQNRASKGVLRNPRCVNKPFAANIRIDGRSKYLGGFATEQEAIAAYQAAARSYFGDFSRWK